MADLTYKDWGRIYAYVWLQDRVGNSYYKDLLEQDPVKGIEAIIQALNREYPDPNLKIEYKPDVDAISGTLSCLRAYGLILSVEACLRYIERVVMTVH